MPDRFGDPHDPRSVREACMDDIRATITAATKRRVSEALGARGRGSDTNPTPFVAPAAIPEAAGGITESTHPHRNGEPT